MTNDPMELIPPSQSDIMKAVKETKSPSQIEAELKRKEAQSKIPDKVATIRDTEFNAALEELGTGVAGSAKIDALWRLAASVVKARHETENQSNLDVAAKEILIPQGAQAPVIMAARAALRNLD